MGLRNEPAPEVPQRYADRVELEAASASCTRETSALPLTTQVKLNGGLAQNKLLAETISFDLPTGQDKLLFTIFLFVL